MKKVSFSDKCRLTQAVLDGYKTRFFYILSGKDLKKLDAFKEEYYTLTMDTLEGVDLANAYLVNYPERLPFGIKDVVAVAQSYKDAGYTCIPYHDTDEYMYLKRNGVILKDISVPSCAVRNKLFVKAELMPHQLMIYGARAERLQDISVADCFREGVRYCRKSESYYVPVNNHDSYYFPTVRDAFKGMVSMVYGDKVWDRNPIVISYYFRLIK